MLAGLLVGTATRPLGVGRYWTGEAVKYAAVPLAPEYPTSRVALDGAPVNASSSCV